MQENNGQSSKSSSEANKKGNFFSDHKAEFKKITWPNRKTLVKQTTTVIFISIIVGIIIFGYDLGIDFIIRSLVKLTA